MVLIVRFLIKRWSNLKSEVIFIVGTSIIFHSNFSVKMVLLLK